MEYSKEIGSVLWTQKTDSDTSGSETNAPDYVINIGKRVAGNSENSSVINKEKETENREQPAKQPIVQPQNNQSQKPRYYKV